MKGEVAFRSDRTERTSSAGMHDEACEAVRRTRTSGEVLAKRASSSEALGRPSKTAEGSPALSEGRAAWARPSQYVAEGKARIDPECGTRTGETSGSKPERKVFDYFLCLAIPSDFDNKRILQQGGVVERFIAPVLKTGEVLKPPWVRIPPPPPCLSIARRPS